MRKLIKLPSPALVIACIALFAAMTTAGNAGVKVGRGPDRAELDHRQAR
jgi:hypothetical protein